MASTWVAVSGDGISALGSLRAAKRLRTAYQIPCPIAQRNWPVYSPCCHSSTSNRIQVRSLNTNVAPPRKSFRPQSQQQRQHSPEGRAQASTATAPAIDLNDTHSRIQQICATVLAPKDGTVPPEQRLLYVFENLGSIANSMADNHSIQAAKGMTRPRNETATSALLGSVNHRQQPISVSRASLLSLISQKAEEIMRNPNVFVTPSVLRSYVDLQSLLHQPSSFPDIFGLYATKPIPQQTQSAQVQFASAAPNKISAAIDADTANVALQAAILAHNLPLAIDIINVTFCTNAYKKSKVLRQALVPIAGVGLAPMAAYTIATQFSLLQNTMSPAHAQTIAFAGILTYFGAVGTVGYVAVTTANDQMDRVTWATGVPLWERWVREDERASFDKVALAWGFKDMSKRGEEEGADWDELKETTGLRGMVLDSVSLMEGME
ncbi:hypothetical protein K431DRAFT_288438 [Polychaeton citri CBS 116435]|uniref:Uncharacterized protein n=1 Tax=Polychaeton citri CBS 116435 TaxID=1314669 RepID=A0A9P4Q3Q2_9PEZI|nr:hypothetical protein K431DRAFT_288438 [Polychaeton citri CBS 116435]